MYCSGVGSLSALRTSLRQISFIYGQRRHVPGVRLPSAPPGPRKSCLVQHSPSHLLPWPAPVATALLKSSTCAKTQGQPHPLPRRLRTQQSTPGTGSAMKVMPKALATLAGQALACIEDPAVIKKILAHLDQITPTTAPLSLPEPRAPPQTGLFDNL